MLKLGAPLFSASTFISSIYFRGTFLLFTKSVLVFIGQCPTYQIVCKHRSYLIVFLLLKVLGCLLWWNIRILHKYFCNCLCKNTSDMDFHTNIAGLVQTRMKKNRPRSIFKFNNLSLETMQVVLSAIYICKYVCKQQCVSSTRIF